MRISYVVIRNTGNWICWPTYICSTAMYSMESDQITAEGYMHAYMGKASKFLIQIARGRGVSMCIKADQGIYQDPAKSMRADDFLK